MTTKYMARFGEVTPVEVGRETAASVEVGGRLRRKDSTWELIFDTKEAAWDWIVERAQDEADKQRRTLDYCLKMLDDAKDARAKALLTETR